MKITDIIRKDILVECDNENEHRAFLEEAEKNSIRWLSGLLPTQSFWIDDYPMYFSLKNGAITSRCKIPYCEREYKIIKFSDLDLSNCHKQKYQLEIKQKKRSVIATLYNDKGAFVKYAKAKCSPEDEFNFETGKKIALQRLFEIEPEPEKEKDTSHKMVLKDGDRFYGYVGDPTEVETYGHIKLFVGDVVELFYKGESKGLCSVCKNLDYPNGCVMSVAIMKFVNGVCSNWLIVKRKSYTEMSVGDVVDDIEYKLT